MFTPKVEKRISLGLGHRRILPWFQRILVLARILTWSINLFLAWRANLHPPLKIKDQSPNNLIQIRIHIRWGLFIIFIPRVLKSQGGEQLSSGARFLVCILMQLNSFQALQDPLQDPWHSPTLLSPAHDVWLGEQISEYDSSQHGITDISKPYISDPIDLKTGEKISPGQTP